MAVKSKNTVKISREDALAFARAWATPENLAKLDAISDEDIADQIAEDTDVAPELDGSWFENARLVIPLKGKKAA